MYCSHFPQQFKISSSSMNLKDLQNFLALLKSNDLQLSTYSLSIKHKKRLAKNGLSHDPIVMPTFCLNSLYWEVAVI